MTSAQQARKSREQREYVAAFVPVSLVRRLDKIADENFSNRSAVLRQILRRGLLDSSRRQIIEG